jgi:hypothetical protein
MARYSWCTPFLAPGLLSLSLAAATAADSIPAKDINQATSPAQPITNTAPAAPTANTPAAVPSAQPDPTAAIVAEGRYIYRQRDVDALVQIASRHTKLRFSKTEEEVLRQAIIGMLISREPLQDAIAHLPPGFSGANRDLFVLDVLDFEGEPSKAVAPPSTPTDSTTPSTAPSSAPPNTAGTVTAPTPEAQGSLLIRLPALHLSRTLPALGKRHLSMTIALFFHNREQAAKLQERAPVIQDAILSYVQGLSPAQFAEPNQLVLKDGITAAIIAKVPDFPLDAVLIPEMDTAAPSAEPKTETKTEGKAIESKTSP